jgi:uncharacterized membrane protein
MKNKNIIEKTFLFAWPYAIVFSLILYLITQNFDFVISFILGFATSLMVNSMNYRIMKATYQTSPDKIKARQIILFVVKYGFMGLILFITYQSNEFNVYYTFVGLFTFVIISIPTAIIFSKRGDVDNE